MENASKALLIAAEVLLGILIISLGVFLFQAFGEFSMEVDNNIANKNIREFNAQYEEFLSKTTITAQDVITLGNMAKNYNNTQESIAITVKVNNVESKYMNAHTLSDKTTYEFINKYSVENKIYFKCEKVNYNTGTGKIDEIILKKI